MTCLAVLSNSLKNELSFTNSSRTKKELNNKQTLELYQTCKFRINNKQLGLKSPLLFLFKNKNIMKFYFSAHHYILAKI
jgi:hypothetical protein